MELNFDTICTIVGFVSGMITIVDKMQKLIQRGE